MNDIVAPVEKNQLENYTDGQKQTLAQTIKKREGINLWLGLEELGRTIGVGGEKKISRKDDAHSISEELERFDKSLAKKRSHTVD